MSEQAREGLGGFGWKAALYLCAAPPRHNRHGLHPFDQRFPVGDVLAFQIGSNTSACIQEFEREMVLLEKLWSARNDRNHYRTLLQVTPW